ncbi:hypothetical protein FGO68_gene11064 [Halteria grandinella]|uniref:HTH araC/xylS-type domain-containing protein n=1 Tax=Halteria grandinella TaxID=5974 RepID=A0A8J8NAZ4_HALGN|nr:hypothetical protein FGO68_gene11064 [Halteria grandinella]
MVEIFDNIHKIYQYRSPCGELKDYIEFFSESSFEATTRHIANECFSVKLFPSWTPTFWINLGSPYQLFLGENRYFIKPEEDVLILRNTIVERRNLPTDHIFTVKFFPGGLEAIFDINQPKLTDKVVNLSTILPAALIQEVKRVDTFEERMEMLQNFFLSQYRKKSTKEHYFKVVQKAIETYGESNMEFSTAEIAKEMFATNKTIYRYFTNVIGTTPKSYFLVLRARKALSAYVSDKELFSPYDYGYYDMSHFYKDVIKFTGKKLVEHIR